MKHLRKWIIIVVCFNLWLLFCTTQAESPFDQFVTPEPQGGHNIFDNAVDMTDDAGKV